MELFQLLATLHLTDLSQETPLHYCARAGNHESLHILLNHIGKDPQKMPSVINRQAKVSGGGKKTKQWKWLKRLSCYAKSSKLFFEWLLNDFPTVPCFRKTNHSWKPCREDKKSWKFFFMNKNFISQLLRFLWMNQKSSFFKNGWSPLLFASDEGHASSVDILLQHSARVDVFDEVGSASSWRQLWAKLTERAFCRSIDLWFI